MKISSAGYAPEAIFSQPLCRQLNDVFQSSLQFPILEHGCCRTDKIIDIRSLVPEWQGRKLEKSYSLAKNDVLKFFSIFGGFPHPKV